MDRSSLQAVIDRWSVGETDWSHDDITTLLAEINRLRGALDRIREFPVGEFRPLKDECEIWRIANETLGSAASANGDSDG